MINIFNFNILSGIIKKSNNNIIKGQAVDDVINTVHMMIGRGAPVEDDFMGFNKLDYGNPTIQMIGSLSPGASVEISEISRALDILRKYKNTQLTNWDSLYSNVYRLINEDSSSDKNIDSSKITYIGKDPYGNSVYRIPLLSTKQFKKIQKELEKYIVSTFANKPNNPFVWKGSLAVWKAFSKNKNTLDNYSVNPVVAPLVSSELKIMGYDSGIIMDVISEDILSDADKLSVDNKNYVFVSDVKNGEIEVSAFYNEIALNFIKSLPSSNRRWAGKQDKDGVQLGTWKIINPSKEFLQRLNSIYIESGFETEELQNIIDNYESFDFVYQQENNPSLQKSLRIEDVSDRDGYYHMAIHFPSNKVDRDEVLELIKYSFPEWPNDGNKGSRFIDKSGKQWKYLIKGSYSDYVNFGFVLKSRSWDTGANSDYRKVLLNLIKSGKVDASDYDGKLDGYQSRDEKGKLVNDIDAFYRDIDNNVKNVTLYDEQKKGVAFLYSKKSAVLGDDTGVGKTIQIVAAADARIRTSGGKCLIITLPSVQKQFAREIHKITGDSSIGFHPADNKKWTVLYYHNFSHGKNEGIQNIVDAIKNDKEISCVVFDEIHMVKNMDAKMSKNVIDATGHIPYKWGATATLIANVPKDAHNPLKIIGHRLGNLSLGTFKRDFGGYVLKQVRTRGGGTRQAYVKGTREDELKAAEKLRKWLVLSGVYLKRSKRDVNKDMTDHIVESNLVDIDLDKFNKDFLNRLNKFKNPDLVISEMQAQRVELAINKAPYSLDMASSILAQDKKVVIFTAFKQSADILVKGLQKILGKDGTVGTVLGKDTREDIDRAKDEFLNKDGNMKAMVISILKGGTGLSLTDGAENVIMNDFSWTPKDAEQAEGRLYRINNTIDVNTTYVIAANSPDEVFFHNVQNKLEIARKIQDLESKERDNILNNIDNSEIRKQIAELNNRKIQLDRELMEDLNSINNQENEGPDDFIMNKQSNINYGKNKMNNWYKIVKSYSIPKRQLDKMNSELINSGLDGNTYFKSISEGLRKIHSVMMDNNIVIESFNANLFLGDEGRRTFGMNLPTSLDDAFSMGEEIENAMLTITWHKMPSGNYEMLAYVS